jgi:hypothetical protein
MRMVGCMALDGIGIMVNTSHYIYAIGKACACTYAACAAKKVY